MITPLGFFLSYWPPVQHRGGNLVGKGSDLGVRSQKHLGYRIDDLIWMQAVGHEGAYFVPLTPARASRASQLTHLHIRYLERGTTADSMKSSRPELGVTDGVHLYYRSSTLDVRQVRVRITEYLPTRASHDDQPDMIGHIYFVSDPLVVKSSDISVAGSTTK